MNRTLVLRLLLSLLATTAFAAAESADFASADAHYDRGRLALERADTATAVRELETAVALAPDSAPCHGALGDAYGRSRSSGYLNCVVKGSRKRMVFGPSVGAVLIHC